MGRHRLLLVLAGGIVAAVSVIDPANAYFGPGAGITMLGALWGLAAGIAVAVFTLIFWPLRIFLRQRRRAKQVKASPGAAPTSSDTR